MHQFKHIFILMIHFKLYREENTPTYCRGRLFADFDDEDDEPDTHVGECLICDTLEPPVRRPSDFIRGRTAIPAGLYNLALTQSPKFGRRLPLLQDVPEMTGIRIHRGNTVADTRGCILPGRYVGKGRIVDSTPREQDIVRLLAESPDPADISIVDDFAIPEPAFDAASDAASDSDFLDFPSLSTWPLADLVERSVWDRLRLVTPAYC